MKAKNGPKARVVAPYNYQNEVAHAVKSYSKGPSIPVTKKNTAVEDDVLLDKRITKLDYSPGFDQPLEDGARNFKSLKGFKQAEQMTIAKSGWKKNPVRQDINEAWGRFTGQEQQ